MNHHVLFSHNRLGERVAAAARTGSLSRGNSTVLRNKTQSENRRMAPLTASAQSPLACTACWVLSAVDGSWLSPSLMLGRDPGVEGAGPRLETEDDR